MKNILLFIIGSLVGTSIAVFAVYTIYTKTSVETDNEVAVVPKQNLEVGIQTNVNKENTKPENLPQAIVLPELQNAVTSDYKLHLENVVSSLNTLINNNNDVILPIMLALPQKLQSGNWGNVFEEVKQVKLAIKDDTVLIKNAVTSLTKLDQENRSTTKDSKILSSTDSFINSSKAFANSFNEYLISVNTLLSGSVPTKEQLNDLNLNIADLNLKTEPFRKDGTNLFLIISQLNSENKK
ncbi:MAG: hypothetical protein K9M11_00575 [Candidatus Pacebacteria bacterium]|nr:hypothetical protein [Candidatus Paceibacterota bacterium]